MSAESIARAEAERKPRPIRLIRHGQFEITTIGGRPDGTFDLVDEAPGLVAVGRRVRGR